jgi:hypothetical protein
VVITVRPGHYGYAIISGLQIAGSSLVVSNFPPLITEHPASQSVFTGQSAGFSVIAESATPVGYQWLFQGMEIQNATNSVLSLTEVQITQAGNYSVRVSNLAGSVTSSNATLVVVNPITNHLLNVQFGAHASPGLDAGKTGLAAVGQSAGDAWNFYSRDGVGGWQTVGAVSHLKLADGSATLSGLIVSNAPGAWAINSSDPMYNTYIYPFSGIATVTLTNLAAGSYDVYAYAHDGNYQLHVAGTDFGNRSCYDATPSGPAVWQEGRQYVRYAGVTVANGQSLTLTVLPGQTGYAVLSGLQLVLTELTPPPPPAAFLVNADFGSGLSPSAKTGLAATGQATNDYWNFYTRDDGAGNWRTFGAITELKQANGVVTGIGMTVANAPGAWGNGASDPMYRDYIYPFQGHATITVTNLPLGQYDFYLYANDGNYQLQVGAMDYGIKTNLDPVVSNPPVWEENRQYTRFANVTITNAAQPVVITVRPGHYGYAIISGLQIAGSSTTGTNECGWISLHPGKANCLRVKFAATPSQRYQVQASTDLKDWIYLGCVIADNQGNCEFEDRDSVKFPHRYYRIVLPPTP